MDRQRDASPRPQSSAEALRSFRPTLLYSHQRPRRAVVNSKTAPAPRRGSRADSNRTEIKTERHVRAPHVSSPCAPKMAQNGEVERNLFLGLTFQLLNSRHGRSEEHTSELQSRFGISYAV